MFVIAFPKWAIVWNYVAQAAQERSWARRSQADYVRTSEPYWAKSRDCWNSCARSSDRSADFHVGALDWW
jgi:hypothetical protein